METLRSLLAPHKARHGRARNLPTLTLNNAFTAKHAGVEQIDLDDVSEELQLAALKVLVKGLNNRVQIVMDSRLLMRVFEQAQAELESQDRMASTLKLS